MRLKDRGPVSAHAERAVPAAYTFGMTQQPEPDPGVHRSDRTFPDPSSLSLPLLEDASAHESRRRQPVDEDEKPRWRGWIHAGTFPVTVVAGVVLISVAEGSVAKWSSAVFM